MKIQDLNQHYSQKFPIYFLAIGLLNLIVYFPSLMHCARSDDLWLLAGISDQESWLSIMKKCFHFTQTVEFNPGDGFLFRPLFFCFLGTLKYLFGYNFIAWQMIGIIGHLLILWVFLKLLFYIRPDFWGALLVAYFSVQVTNTDMVVWEHIFGYRIAVLFMLIGITQLYLYFVKGQNESWRIWLIMFAMLVACFSYEIMNIFCLLFALYALIYSPKTKKIANSFFMIFPGIAYFLSSRGIAAGDSSTMGGLPFFTNTLKNISLTNTNLFWMSAFGGNINNFYILERTCYWAIKDLGSWPNIITVLLTGVFFITFFSRFKPSQNLPKTGFVYLILSMLLTFVGVYSIVRINSRGLQYLGNAPYNSYIYWLFLLILLYFIFNSNENKNLPKFLPSRVFKILLILVIYMNSLFSFALLYTMAIKFRPRVRFVSYIEFLVKRHKNEKDFSFYADNYVVGNDLILWIHKKGDPNGRLYSIAELLFPNYYRTKNPKYLIQSSFFVEDPQPLNTEIFTRR